MADVENPYKQANIVNLPEVPERKVNLGNYDLVLSKTNLLGQFKNDLPQEDVTGIQDALKVLDISKSKGWLDENDKPVSHAPQDAIDVINQAVTARDIALRKGFLQPSAPESQLNPMQSYAGGVLNSYTFGTGTRILPYILAGMAKAGQATGMLPEDPNTLQNMKSSMQSTYGEAKKTNPGLNIAGTALGYAGPENPFGMLFNTISKNYSVAQIANNLGMSIADAGKLIGEMKGLPEGFMASPALSTAIPTMTGRMATMSLSNLAYEGLSKIAGGEDPKKILSEMPSDAKNGLIAGLASEAVQGGFKLFTDPSTATKEAKNFLTQLYASNRGDLAPSSIRQYANPKTRPELESAIKEGIPAKAKQYSDEVNSILKEYEDTLHKGKNEILSKSPNQETSLKPIVDNINERIKSLQGMGRDVSGGRDAAVKELIRMRDDIYSTLLPNGGVLARADKIPTTRLTKYNSDLYSFGENYYKETGNKLPEAVDKEIAQVASKMRDLQIAAGRDANGKVIKVKGKSIEDYNNALVDFIKAKDTLDINSLYYGGPSRLGWLPEKLAKTALRTGKRGIAPNFETDAAQYLDNVTENTLGKSSNIIDKAQTMRAIHDFSNPEMVSAWYTGRANTGLLGTGLIGHIIGEMVGHPAIGAEVGGVVGGLAMSPRMTKPILRTAGDLGELIGAPLEAINAGETIPKLGKLGAGMVNELNPAINLYYSNPSVNKQVKELADKTWNRLKNIPGLY